MSQVISFADYTPPARFDDTAWETARVEEGPTSSGPWTLIDTLTLDPVDADPSDPQTRNLTTSLASDTPDLWYRLTFVDADSGTSQPSNPIQNSGPPTMFATAGDLADRLGVTLTDDETVRASALLATASEIIRDEAKQQIGLETETITMPGTNDSSIELPQHPVFSVSSVTVDGTELVEGSDWYLDGNLIVRLPSISTIALLDRLDDQIGVGGFGVPSQTVSITYTHGYADVPAIVKGICLEMVTRVWVNPGSVGIERIGDTATTYDTYKDSPNGLMLSDKEQQTLKRFFGIRARSVSIGR